MKSMVREFVDSALQAIHARDLKVAHRLLNQEFNALVEACNQDVSFLRHYILNHALGQALMKDPLTRRAQIKPRGYPGDAETLDFVYCAEEKRRFITDDTGLFVNQLTALGSMGASVIHRKELIAEYINATCWKSEGARILSVACGHARELSSAMLLSNPAFAECTFIGIDFDEESCAYCKRNYGEREHIQFRADNVLKLASSKYNIGSFDLIYSSGLYDYLDFNSAVRLTSALVKRLGSGGMLIIANFLESCDGKAYMECVMDWSLHWRTVADFDAIYENISAQVNGDLEYRSVLDPYGNILYGIYQTKQ